jgi:hypothetical protein
VPAHGNDRTNGVVRFKFDLLEGLVIFQLIVNVNGSQSVSTRPSSATAPSRQKFVGPRTIRFQPGGVTNRYGIVQVMVPNPNIDRGSLRESDLKSNLTESRSGLSFHSTSKVAGFRISQPYWFAMRRGKHRFAQPPVEISIQ